MLCKWQPFCLGLNVLNGSQMGGHGEDHYTRTVHHDRIRLSRQSLYIKAYRQRSFKDIHLPIKGSATPWWGKLIPGSDCFTIVNLQVMIYHKQSVQAVFLLVSRTDTHKEVLLRWPHHFCDAMMFTYHNSTGHHSKHSTYNQPKDICSIYLWVSARRCNSIANTLDLCVSCTSPSIYITPSTLIQNKPVLFFVTV